MSNDTESLHHLFTPYLSVATDADGSNPRLEGIDFFDSYQNTVANPSANFVDGLETGATEFLDSLYPQMIEACKAIAEGKTLVALDSKPIETDSADDGGSGCPGVIVWFGEGENAAASKFRSDVNAVVYS